MGGGVEVGLWGQGRGVPRPSRLRRASHLPAQLLGETTRDSGRKQRCGMPSPFLPVRTHDLEPVQSARLVHSSPCASPWQGRGPPSGVAREKPGRSGRSSSPLPTGFSESKEKKKNGSRSRAGEGAQGQGPGQPGDGGGGGEGDPNWRGRRGLRSGKEAAGGTEVGAPRLTKPAEGAALWLPVLRAPPREPRSPAAPSGSPAPPPLWEATWTCRFGPSAKSRLQGGGSPSPRLGSPSSSPCDRRLSVSGTPLQHVAKPRGSGAGTRLGGQGEGLALFGASGPASGPDADCGAGGLPGRSPPGGRALREREPGGGASESESDKPLPL